MHLKGKEKRERPDHPKPLKLSPRPRKISMMTFRKKHNDFQKDIRGRCESDEGQQEDDWNE